MLLGSLWPLTSSVSSWRLCLTFTLTLAPWEKKLKDLQWEIWREKICMCVYTVDPHYLQLHIWEFSCSLKFIWNLKSKLSRLSQSLVEMHRAVKNLNCPIHALPAEVKQGDALPSCFSAQTAMSRGWRRRVQCSGVQETPALELVGRDLKLPTLAPVSEVASSKSVNTS